MTKLKNNTFLVKILYLVIKTYNPTRISIKSFWCKGPPPLLPDFGLTFKIRNVRLLFRVKFEFKGFFINTFLCAILIHQ